MKVKEADGGWNCLLYIHTHTVAGRSLLKHPSVHSTFSEMSHKITSKKKQK